MRKALFRGFCRNENGKETICLNGEAVKGDWVYGGYAKCNNREYILPDIDLVGYEWVFKNIEVIPETVCEAVRGLTDKNEQQVFEGDRLKKGFETVEVCWNASQCRYSFYIDNMEVTGCNQDTLRFMEVIGTKWDKENKDEISLSHKY